MFRRKSTRTKKKQSSEPQPVGLEGNDANGTETQATGVDSKAASTSTSSSESVISRQSHSMRMSRRDKKKFDKEIEKLATTIPLEDTVMFKVKYLGFVQVNSSQGDHVVGTAVIQIKNQKTDPVKCFLILRKSDLLLATKKGDILLNLSVGSITFTSVNPVNPTQFALISESKGSTYYCHVFSSKDGVADAARAISKAIVENAKMVKKIAVGTMRDSFQRGKMLASLHSSSMQAQQTTPTNPPIVTQPPAVPVQQTTASSNLKRQGSQLRARSGSVGASVRRYSGSLSTRPSFTRSAALPSEGVTQVAVYLGYELVGHLAGKMLCMTAVKRNSERWAAIKKERQHADGKSVNIVITNYAIQTIDRRSDEPAIADFIRSVSFTCVARKTQTYELFTYISHDERLKRTVCHIYRVMPGQGDQICSAIAQVRGKESLVLIIVFNSRLPIRRLLEIVSVIHLRKYEKKKK